MQQYYCQNNILILKVKKSPVLVRIIMFLFTFLFFILPIGGAIAGILDGSGLRIGYLISIGIFSLLGFFLLRLSLWNTYGEETIQFLEEKIVYEANYGWFKDGRKETPITEARYFYNRTGYEDDNEGVLVIASDETKIESVVKIPISQLEELITKLNNRQSNYE